MLVVGDKPIYFGDTFAMRNPRTGDDVFDANTEVGFLPGGVSKFAYISMDLEAREKIKPHLTFLDETGIKNALDHAKLPNTTITPAEVRNLQDGLQLIETHKRWLKESAPDYYERVYFPVQHAQNQALDAFVRLPPPVQDAVTSYMFAIAKGMETDSFEAAAAAMKTANDLVLKQDRKTQDLFWSLGERMKKLEKPEDCLTLATSMRNIIGPEPARHEAESGAERPKWSWRSLLPSFTHR